MDERAVETVLGAVFAVIGGTGESEVVAFDADGEFGVDGLSELTFGAFDGYYVLIHGDGYAGGDFNRSFTYS